MYHLENRKSSVLPSAYQLEIAVSNTVNEIGNKNFYAAIQEYFVIIDH